MDLGLKQRRAVVTGASRGIGRAIAAALAAEGADVVAAARNAQKLQELVASVQPGTGTITAHMADMSKAADIQGLADDLEKTDILVFNTGGPPFCTAAETTDASWTTQFEAMFLSAIRLTRLALPGMRTRRYGRIMLVVSSGVPADSQPGAVERAAIRARRLGEDTRVGSRCRRRNSQLSRARPHRYRPHR